MASSALACVVLLPWHKHLGTSFIAYHMGVGAVLGAFFGIEDGLIATGWATGCAFAAGAVQWILFVLLQTQRNLRYFLPYGVVAFVLGAMGYFAYLMIEALPRTAGAG